MNKLLIVCSIIAVSIFIIFSYFSNKTDNKKPEMIAYTDYLIGHGFDPFAKIDNINTNLKNEEELKLCEQYIKENPNSTYGIYKRAKLNFLLHNYDIAKRDYLSLLDKSPTDTLYISSYVDCYIMENKPVEAKDILERYYKNIKKDTRYYGHLGRIYTDIDNLDLAIENYKKAIELEPSSTYKYELEAVAKIIELRKNKK